MQYATTRGPRPDRRRFLRAAGATGLLALTGGAAACAVDAGLETAAPGPGDVIRIGYVTPETGPLAPLGEAERFVATAMGEILSARPITVGGRPHRVEILTRDSQSDGQRAADVAAGLALDDRVHLVLVSAGADTVNAVSDQCEAAGVPCVAASTPWQSWFHLRGGRPESPFRWTYLMSWGMEDAQAVYADLWDEVATNRVVGAFWSNSAEGLAWNSPGTGLPAALAERGYTLVDPGVFEDGTPDFSAWIDAFRAADAQVLLGVASPLDLETFWRQAAERDYRPRIATIGRGARVPASVERLDPPVVNLGTEVSWSPSHPFTSSLTGMSAGDLAAEYTARTGRQWTQPIGFAHALFEVAAAAFGAVGSIDDREGVARAIAGMRLDTVIGPVDFTAGPVPGVAKTPLAGGQWQAGETHPFELVVVSNARYPQVPTAGRVEPLG
jgi:branched-chain amino acid transport system substrate-binding protein